VSRMNTPLQQLADVVQGGLDQVTEISRTAAEKDKAGTWGLDGWIRVIHNLLDVQAKAYAAFLQTAIAGPWVIEPPSYEPPPCDPITVEATKYPRKLAILSPAFVRLGQPEVKIPKSCIAIHPDVLPAGGTEFRIVLNDYRFVGANYTGTIRLTNTGDAAAKPDDRTVTVGL
jgi:hypothetical protein